LFNFDDLPTLPHGKHEEDLIDDAGAGEATAGYDVKEILLSVLQGVPPDKGDVFIAPTVLLRVIQALLQRLLRTALLGHRVDRGWIQRVPHQLGVKADHTADVLV